MMLNYQCLLLQSGLIGGTLLWTWDWEHNQVGPLYCTDCQWIIPGTLDPLED